MPSFTRELEETFHRTVAYANQRRHEYATLEHLLLGLLDDPDARGALSSSGADLARLRQTTLDYIDDELRSLIQKGTITEDAKPTAGFQRVVQRAVLHTQAAKLEFVDGVNVLVALFSERTSHAAYFLQQAEVTRYNIVDYNRSRAGGSQKLSAKQLKRFHSVFSGAGEDAPEFRVSGSRFRLTERKSTSAISERKAAVEERCLALQQICSRRSNEQPALHRLVTEYADALAALRSNSGAYNLFLYGIEIETLLRTKERLPPDPERNPPLDGDIAFAVQSLVIAHAGLLALFPDAAENLRELDRYKSNTDGLNALRDRVLDPVISQLASADKLFDEGTRGLAVKVRDLDETGVDTSTEPTIATTATKHGWLRGALSAMGRFLVTQMQAIAKAGRDAGTKEGISATIRNHETLAQNIISFIQESQNYILELAHKLPGAFGFVESILRILGLH